LKNGSFDLENNMSNTKEKSKEEKIKKILSENKDESTDINIVFNLNENEMEVFNKIESENNLEDNSFGLNETEFAKTKIDSITLKNVFLL
jgi:hypothetical protein